MKKRCTLRWLISGAVALCICLCVSLSARAAGSPVEELLSQVKLQPMVGETSFTVGGVEFQHLLIPGYVLDMDEGEGPVPGDSGDLVRTYKLHLYTDHNFPANEFITYSQIRPPVESNRYTDLTDEECGQVSYYFDEHLATLLKTIYRFCGLEDKSPCLDEQTLYILDHLPGVSTEMLQDIERLYKYTLAVEGTQGTVSRSGQLHDLYYYAQTDPDWAEEKFEYKGNGDTIRDRGCGCACASMIVSTYCKVEINPYHMKNIAISGDWPVDYGLPNDYFKDVASQYRFFKDERYNVVLEKPVIIEKEDLDMAKLAEWIGEDGYMAVIHVVKGAFTSQEHYMVLADYQVIDGKGYFLVADPYEQQSRYTDRDQLILETEHDQEGIFYATSELLERDCKSVILFMQDRRTFPVFSAATEPEALTASAR